MDIPLPVIYLNKEHDGTYSVVDGQQRLTALFDFFENKFSLNHLMVLEEIIRRNQRKKISRSSTKRKT
ncbi:MAG: DUF262 domain-containing protein [Leptospiraceae bacterium]|jgi:uncharacterized protein with ParB-like and HNH nuclease domain|nr:DUF262 domain-containing protein [Leptospiraceae bacterium]